MKIIYTSNGTEIKVDDRDYEFLSQWKWKLVGTYGGYAARNTRHGTIYMHRLLAGFPEKGEVDHKNGDRHDNRKYNLRVVDHTSNQRNLNALNRRNSSGVRGVSWFPRTKKWVARIRVGGKNLGLGYFDTVEEAGAAREAAEKKYWSNK